MRTFAVFVMIAAAMAITVFGGYILFVRDTAGLLRPDDAPLVARGAPIYLQHCASCHGIDLEGQPDWQTRDKDGYLPAPPHDESGHTWHHPDRLLFEITKRGVAEAANLKDYTTRMPAFGDVLVDDEIVAVLSYIKSRWPEKLRRSHDELNRFDAKRRR